MCSGVTCLFFLGAFLPTPHVFVPQGIKSVNGSNVSMQCARQQVNIGNRSSLKSENCLFDGNSPEVNTNVSNWASQLVTVRKNIANDNITYDHVLLTFKFDAAVALTSMELDVFLCPEWNISAPFVTVYGSNSTVFTAHDHVTSGDFIANYRPSKSSCGCLSTIRMPLQHGEPSYPVWHVVFSFHIEEQQLVQWVHVGEVRFFDTPRDPNPATFCAIEYDPDSSELITCCI